MDGFYCACAILCIGSSISVFSTCNTNLEKWFGKFLALVLLGCWVAVLLLSCNKHTHTHIHFNGPSGTTRVSRYQKHKTNLDFTEARDSEWQWHQLGHMQVCTSLQTDNHASTLPLSFLQAGCPSCRPTNSVKALKAYCHVINTRTKNYFITVYAHF